MAIPLPRPATPAELADANVQMAARAPYEIQVLIRGTDQVSKTSACDKAKALSIVAQSFSNSADPMTIAAVRIDPAVVQTTVLLLPDLQRLLTDYCDPNGSMNQITAIAVADRMGNRTMRARI